MPLEKISRAGSEELLYIIDLQNLKKKRETQTL